MNKQRNLIIKPIRVDNSNKLLNKLFPSKGNNNALQQQEGQTAEPKQQKYTSNGQSYDSDDQDNDYDYDDDYSDTTSVSSVESDCQNINIWDNSELRLRGINTEEFTDFYGKKLSFLQLYKLRSSYYTKGYVPQLGDIFKDAEKIHKFCHVSLKLDEFLEEEARYNIIDINLNQDKNFSRFHRYFEQELGFNSQKFRDEKYDRYSCVAITGHESPNSSAGQGRNQVYVRNRQRMISGLNLSPRKPQEKTRLFTENNKESQVRKSQLNLHQLSEMMRKQKLQISQQKQAKQGLGGQICVNDEDIHQEQFLISDMGVQDNFVSTSESNNKLSNSSCGSQPDCQSRNINKNPTNNQISFKFSGSPYNSHSPTQSPVSNNSFKRGSPNNSQKSPLNNDQAEFRLKLCNTQDFDDTQVYGSIDMSRKISQNNNNQNYQMGNKNDSRISNSNISSFTKFSTSQSPKKRTIINSLNGSPLIKPQTKQSYEFNSFSMKQAQNSMFTSPQFKPLNSINNNLTSSQGQRTELSSLNGKNNINNSIKEIKLPNISTIVKEKKQSIKMPSSDSPVRSSKIQLFNQGSGSGQSQQQQQQSGSPNQIQSPIMKPTTPFNPHQIMAQKQSQIFQQSSYYPRTHKKYQSTLVGEEQKKQFQQLLYTKQ